MSISITGIGILSAIGHGCEETLSALRNRETGIAAMHHLSSAHTELPVGEVKKTDNELKAMLGVDDGKIVSRNTLLGAVAAREALMDAGLLTTEGKPADAIKGKRVAIVAGTTVGGMDVTERYFSEMLTDDTHLSLLLKHHTGSSTDDVAALCFPDVTDFTLLPTCTVSTACSSALNAIIVGSEMLKDGEADIVLAGGMEALSRFHLNGFNTLMILDHEQCKPFDAGRAGINLGEGAAFLVLEKDRDRGYGYIGGYGNASDAFHQTASSEDGEGAYLAMKKAVEMAGLYPTDIHYVNAHGTGTQNNDRSESVALQRLFGERMPAVSSTKSFTGHTTSASGSIEAVICLLAMREQFIPASLNFSTPDEGMIVPSRGEDHAEIHNILCNSFGFGGNDSSLVIMDSCPDVSTALASDTDVVTLADVTINDIEQLKDFREFISPMEGRRMGKLMKAATLTSMKALKLAGITTPDAIVTATAYGMIETSEKFLADMCENGEETLSPTLFMQSTHNTIGSAIAIRTKCHGYNITFTQGDRSLECALHDAHRLLRSGSVRNVLVGIHDEATPRFLDFADRLSAPVPPMIFSRSILLTLAEKG